LSAKLIVLKQVSEEGVKGRFDLIAGSKLDSPQKGVFRSLQKSLCPALVSIVGPLSRNWDGGFLAPAHSLWKKGNAPMFNLYCPLCETAFCATKERAGEVIQCSTCQKELVITCPRTNPARARDFAIPTALSMLSSNLVIDLPYGKYWRGARRLDADRLEALLCAIGEFGKRYTALGRPEPRFYPHAMDERRMREPLQIFADIYSVGRWETDYVIFTPCHWGTGTLRKDLLVFPQEYRTRLARNQSAAWATNLDEWHAAVLLWMTGEYGTRANSSRGMAGPGSEYLPPEFSGLPAVTHPMRMALRWIARIEGRWPASAEEVCCDIVGCENSPATFPLA
jgi:hypothetical protein